MLTPNRKTALHIVQPHTLLRWHRDLTSFLMRGFSPSRVTRSTEILDPVLHLIRFQYGGKQFEKTHPVADTMFVLLAKDDAGLFDTGGCKIYVVGIVGAENIAEMCGPYKMVEITVA